MKTKLKKIKSNRFDIELDDEETELSKALDKAVSKGKLKSAANLKEKIAFAKEAAENYFRKDSRVNIRISSNDLKQLKRKAAYKGLPYQTFIAGILHEYAAGHFD